MSALMYGDINLPMVHTTAFDQSPMYDELGQTDWYCTRIDLKVNAVINLDYINLIAPGFTGLVNNTADLMKAIRVYLLKPRRKLTFTFNGVDLIPNATAGLGLVDAQNGPQPQSCTITELTNTTFFITYHVVTFVWENNLVAANRAGCSVLNNRWTESVDIDNRNFTTRTRHGKFRIRSDNQLGWTADQFRGFFANLAVPAGFLRVSSQYKVDPSGLAIEYTVVDREFFKPPPSPAFHAEGEFTMSTPTIGGAVRFGACTVRLKGMKSNNQQQSQAKLLETAMGVVASKLARGSGVLGPGGTWPPVLVFGTGGNAILHSAYAKVNLYDNIVEVSMRVQYTVDGARLVSVPMLDSDYCFTPGSDGQVVPTPSYKDRGSASLLLQAAAYYDPNLTVAQTTLNASNQTGTGLQVGQAGVTKE